MAITKSAKKANRQSKRRKRVNDLRRRALATALKTARIAGSGNTEALKMAYKAIDKAKKGGIIKKNTADRRKAKVARLLAAK